MVQLLSFCVIVGLLAGTSFAHICDTCDCQPERNEVFSITCDCQSTMDLHLTSSMMMGVESTAMVIIRNCQTVSVERNSFSQLQLLDTLGIMNCSQLYLAAGAFSSLNSLLINNVQDISFGEMALMGARGVKNIIINNSNITNLPKFSLYDVEGMDRFSMNGVNIGRINKHAFNITAKTVGIDNSKINYIEPSGFALRAQKVLINKSELLFGEPNSMDIKTEHQTRFIKNSFGGFFQINITAPFAEFYGNRFENFASSVLDGVQTPRMMGNLIYNTDFDLFRRFGYRDFYENEFVCKCGMRLLNYTKNSNNYEILKKNLCMTNCTLSLYDFEIESMAACMKDRDTDANNYCNYERRFKNDPRSTHNDGTHVQNNFTDVKLQPRFLAFDEESSGAAGVEYKYALILTTILSFLFSYFC